MPLKLKKGLYTALITPFKDGEVDFVSLEKLLSFQLDAGVPSVVLCGTTGEASALSSKEKLNIAEFAVKFCGGKASIILNVGTNNTTDSAELANKALKTGVDGLLAVAPYYVKPPQEGLFLHFKKIAQSTELPVILYNVPSRTGVDIKDETTARLAEISNILGLKDATGDLSRVPSLRSLIGRNFLLLSGEDTTALAFNASGGDGIISVVSNVTPKLTLELQELSLARTNFNRAFETQDIIHKIAKVLFMEANPVPVKFLASLKGLCAAEYRLPLCTPSEASILQIKNILSLC